MVLLLQSFLQKRRPRVTEGVFCSTFSNVSLPTSEVRNEEHKAPHSNPDEGATEV